jgi:Zn-dependent protease
MFGHGIPIGRVSGIVIDLDYSWFLIAGLLAWLLAVSYYPAKFHNWSTSDYWLMGVISAIGLFVSVLVHELGHRVVAAHYRISVPRITLFIFGGISQFGAKAPTAAAEFWIAVVGPIVSFAVAALFWGLEALLVASPLLLALAKYLASLNVILGEFNLMPGFPLDGGRVFRAIVWSIVGKYEFAAFIAGITGRLFGFLLIFVGVWQVLSEHFFDGLWIAVIGWFLERAAENQLQQERLKSALADHEALGATKRGVPPVPGTVTAQDFVERIPFGQHDHDHCQVI